MHRVDLTGPYAFGSEPIWRHLDLAKLTMLLTREELWFSRLDALVDPHEGHLGAAAGAWSEQWAWTKVDAAAMYEDVVATTTVSCWFQRAEESMAMWQVYAGSGVAIVSSPNSLAAALEARWENADLMPWFGRVLYTSATPSAEELEAINPVTSVYRKWPAWDWEHEFRVASIGHKGSRSHGVPVALGLIVERIVLAPRIDELTEQAVRALVGALRPELKDRIKPSTLLVGP